MKTLIAILLLAAATMFGADMKAPKIGEAAPAFKLKNYDGKEYGLKELLAKNKLVVAMFISTQCPVSNGYNERMEKLYETYAEKGVAIVGINSNMKETPDDISAHAKLHGFKFPVLKDLKNVVADAYAAEHTPEIYVINAKGNLEYHGRIDDSRDAAGVHENDLADALDALLAGKTPAHAETKAVGCSIKRVDMYSGSN